MFWNPRIRHKSRVVCGFHRLLTASCFLFSSSFAASCLSFIARARMALSSSSWCSLSLRTSSCLKEASSLPAPRMAGKTSSKTHERNSSAVSSLDENMSWYKPGSDHLVAQQSKCRLPCQLLGLSALCVLHIACNDVLYAFFTCSSSVRVIFLNPNTKHTSLPQNHSSLSVASWIR